jgi:hypothetical protein
MLSKEALACVMIGMFGLAGQCAAASPQETILMKAGETVDLGPVYWISNCRSLLQSTPVAEVMEGPPQLTVSVKEKMVLPRKQSCARPVSGGELTLSAAKDINVRTEGKLFVRVKYQTKDGERQTGREIDYTLFPAPQPAPASKDSK